MNWAYLMFFSVIGLMIIGIMCTSIAIKREARKIRSMIMKIKLEKEID